MAFAFEESQNFTCKLLDTITSGDYYTKPHKYFFLLQKKVLINHTSTVNLSINLGFRVMNAFLCRLFPLGNFVSF